MMPVPDAKMRGMRTTVRIDDGLYREVKARAARSGRTVGELIEDALRASLHAAPAAGTPLRPLPVFGGSGVMPGVDLTSNASIRGAMEEGLAMDARR